MSNNNTSAGVSYTFATDDELMSAMSNNNGAVPDTWLKTKNSQGFTMWLRPVPSAPEKAPALREEGKEEMIKGAAAFLEKNALTLDSWEDNAACVIDYLKQHYTITLNKQ